MYDHSCKINDFRLKDTRHLLSKCASFQLCQSYDLNPINLERVRIPCMWLSEGSHDHTAYMHSDIQIKQIRIRDQFHWRRDHQISLEGSRRISRVDCVLVMLHRAHHILCNERPVMYFLIQCASEWILAMICSRFKNLSNLVLWVDTENWCRWWCLTLSEPWSARVISLNNLLPEWQTTLWPERAADTRPSWQDFCSCQGWSWNSSSIYHPTRDFRPSFLLTLL